MPLPPKGDPQRPLHLAVRSTRVLGILFLALGTCGMLPMFFVGVRGGRAAAPGPPMAIMGAVAVSTVVFYLGPGALYLVCSTFIARRRTWAVITAMVVGGIHMLLIGMGLLWLGIFLVRGARAGAFVLIPLGIGLLVLLALAQLEYHLSKCFEAIRFAPVEMQRGFEPLAVVPVRPAMSESDADDAAGR